jgi:hypothetical protein
MSASKEDIKLLQTLEDTFRDPEIREREYAGDFRRDSHTWTIPLRSRPEKRLLTSPITQPISLDRLAFKRCAERFG